MADLEELQAKITLDTDSFSVGIGQVTQKLDALEAAVASVGVKLESSLEKGLGGIGKGIKGINLDQVSGKLSAAADKLQAAFTDVVQPAIDFEAAMRNVNTVAKLSDAELAGLSEQMRTLGREIGLGIPPTEAAAAQYDILSAGFSNAADATKVLTAAAVASRGGLVTVQESADVLTSALGAYGAGADQAGKFSDVLFSSIAAGKVTFAEYAQGLGQVVPAAAGNKVSFEELTSAVAALTNNAVKAPQAFTGLNAAIVQLGAPTEEARKAAAGLGIDLDGAAFKGLSLVEKLQVLARAAGENKSALRRVLGDVNALGVAYTLAGNGSDDYAAALTAAQNPQGLAAKAAQEQAKSVKAAREEFSAAAEALKISVSEAILPALTGIAKGGKDVLEFLDSFSPATKAAAGIVAALGTAITVTVGSILSFALGLRGCAFALGVELPAASVIASGAMTKIGVAAARARAGILSVNGAALAGPLGLVALGVAATEAALAYVEMSKAADAAADAIVNVGGKALGGTNTTVSTGTLLSTPVADLKKQGVKQEDVQNRIRELRETLEQAAAAGDTQTAKILEGKVKKLIAVREQLDQPLKAEKSAQKAAEVSDKVKNFKLQPVVDQAAEKERRKAALFEIEQADLTKQARIKALEDYLKRENLAGQERRNVEQKIHQLKLGLQKEQDTAAKKSAADKIANELQAIQHSKAGIDQQIAQLEVLAKKYKDNGAVRRKIEDEIATLQAKKAKEAEDQAKRQADVQQGASEANRQVSAGKVEDLQRSRARGGDLVQITNDLADQFRAEGEDAKKKIQAKLAEQLADPKNKGFAVELKRTAQVKIQEVDANTGRKIRDAQDQAVQDQSQRDQASIDSAKSTADARLDVLQREGAAGKNVRSQIESTILDRFKLEEAGIRATADAQKAATDNAVRAAEIERQAQISIQAARQKAADEIERQNGLLDEQAKKAAATGEKGPIKGGQTGKFDFTLGGVSGDLNSVFGGGGAEDAAFAARQDATKLEALQKRIRAQTGLKSPQEILNALDTGNPQIKDVLKGVDLKEFRTKLAPGGATQPAPVEVKVAPIPVEFNIKLTHPDGSTQTQRVTVAGVPGPAQGANSVNFGTRGRA